LQEDIETTEGQDSAKIKTLEEIADILLLLLFFHDNDASKGSQTKGCGKTIEKVRLNSEKRERIDRSNGRPSTAPSASVIC